MNSPLFLYPLSIANSGNQEAQNQINQPMSKYSRDPYKEWGMDYPEEGEEDVFEDWGND